MPGVDPISLATSAVQGVAGLAQTILGSRQAKKATRELEALPNPKTTSSASIADYYQKATANPYETAMYRLQKNQLQRNVAQGIGALQDRRSGLLGITSLIRGQNDATLRLGANAEQQQRSMLGDAVRLKARDDERVFGINEMMPFERKYSLLASKAAGGNQIMNAGMSNLFGAFGSAGMAMSAADKKETI